MKSLWSYGWPRMLLGLYFFTIGWFLQSHQPPPQSAHYPSGNLLVVTLSQPPESATRLESVLLFHYNPPHPVEITILYPSPASYSSQLETAFAAVAWPIYNHSLQNALDTLAISSGARWDSYLVLDKAALESAIQSTQQAGLRLAPALEPSAWPQTASTASPEAYRQARRYHGSLWQSLCIWSAQHPGALDLLQAVAEPEQHLLAGGTYPGSPQQILLLPFEQVASCQLREP